MGSKSFRRKKILDSVSLEIKKGQIVGLVGNSGAGKSVFIKTLIGFYKPDSGKIIIDSPLKFPIGFSMQENSLYDSLTVKQNFIYFAEIYGIPRKIRDKRIANALNFLKLTEFSDVLVKKLSGGTKKRVDIGCAFLNDPEILILDEPFLGLDPMLVKSLSKYIIDFNKAGKTLLISSHQLEILSQMCTDFMLLENKKLIRINKADLGEIY